MRTKIDFNLEHGLVEGMYVRPVEDSGPLVVITNGHNGFYAYGMFPYIQDALADAGISSYSYNFSHGGVRNGEDYFTDLVAYEKNCMRLEKLDLLGVLGGLSESPIPDRSEGIFLLSHSLGSIPMMFAAAEAVERGTRIAGMIPIAPLRTLDVFPESMMKEWRENGVYHMKNNRTGQDLPQGAEFLAEIEASSDTWNVERVARSTANIGYLLIHGADDKDVPVDHSKAIKAWVEESGGEAALRFIEGAGHTFNTAHPFKCRTPELDEVIRAVQEWIAR